MRYAKGSLVINPQRDIPLLRQIRNSRFVSQRQLFELLHYQDLASCRSTFNWRMQRLLKSRYITCLEGISWRGSPVYSIAVNGLIQLESDGDFAIALHSQTRNMPHRSQVFHGLELNEIRVALARNNLLADWRSEVEIASNNMVSGAPYQKDYDAIVTVWAGAEMREFALEYERLLKGARHYARIRAALECERQVACVLYLTASPDLMSALVYQLTPLACPIAFATARSFREHLLATPVCMTEGGAMLTLHRFLEHAHPLDRRHQTRAGA
jgi:hypothetical protein